MFHQALKRNIFTTISGNSNENTQKIQDECTFNTFSVNFKIISLKDTNENTN